MKKQNAKQASWGGRFKESPSDLMLRFSESVSFDKKLALFDIACSSAHATMLGESKIISKKESASILKGLSRIKELVEKDKISWSLSLEDVHMNIEQTLTKICPEAAKLHTARSRNDQVATDMRLFFKDACKNIVGELKNLLKVLANLAEKNQNVLIPGYTHLQRAQPVSVAHHILAWAQNFERDLKRFNFVFESANICPLGSGAIAGTTLPIKREISAKFLGFCDKNKKPILTQNSMDAVSDRDVFLEFVSACAMLGVHISRVAEDVIIWNTSEFGFIKLPDAFTTGSSLMPQKKNPDSFELLRGKSARLIGNMNTLFALVKGLPLTYNRDLQEDKVPVFDSSEQVLISIKVLSESLAGAEFNKKKCQDAVSDPLLLATDLADYLVDKGMPFRKAHHVVGALVALSEELKINIDEIPDPKALAVCKELGKNWRKVFDLKRAMTLRKGIGMPNATLTKSRINYFKKL